MRTWFKYLLSTFLVGLLSSPAYAITTYVSNPPANVSTGATSTKFTSYAVGTAYSLTGGFQALTFGTTSPSITITTAGTYIILGGVVVKYNAATFAANQGVTFQFRRTNNTASTLPSSPISLTTGIVTTSTSTLAAVSLPPIIYTTALTNDVIVIQGAVDNTPSAGSLDVTEANIIAVRIA